MLHVKTSSNVGAAKTRASCFITGSKQRDEALALVFDVFHQASKAGTNERKQLKTKLETFLV